MSVGAEELDYALNSSEFDGLIDWLRSKKTEIVQAMTEYVEKAVACKPYGDDEPNNPVASEFKKYADSLQTVEIADLDNRFDIEIKRGEELLRLIKANDKAGMARAMEATANNTTKTPTTLA